MSSQTNIPVMQYGAKNIHEKAIALSEIMNEALDSIAPIKNFTIKDLNLSFIKVFVLKSP